nr:Gag-Pol polyprotein [Tanacetum cinerariifolium]
MAKKRPHTREPEQKKEIGSTCTPERNQDQRLHLTELKQQIQVILGFVDQVKAAYRGTSHERWFVAIQIISGKSLPGSFLRSRLHWWSPTGRLFDHDGKLVASSKSESHVDYSNGDNACTSNAMEPKIKWFPNFTSLLGRLSRFVYRASTQWGNILITRVYFVEGLGHNLLSVGQFCDSDLEVTFRRNACFVRNLEGVDLLKGDRSTNLYTFNLYEMASASPICLMARASSTKSCAVSPDIFIINATFILLIHEVVFNTSKKFDYPPLVNNVDWLGLLSVARLGGQRTLGCGGAIIAQFPNLMRHRVRTTGNRSMGGLESFCRRKAG